MHESTIIRIKEKMLHLNLSQTKLANLLGWDQAKISRILTKDYDPKMGELEKLAEVLKLIQSGCCMVIIRRAFIDCSS